MASREIVPNDATFKYYFYFIQERMNMFWRKVDNSKIITEDSILQEYKFTNVYRACDRVSQYLIRNVISKDLNKYSAEDMLLRILVFKVFNRISTWEYLEEVHPVSKESFDVNELSQRLSERQKSVPIFSNAYMMAGSHSKYEYIDTKHRVWLKMIEEEFVSGHGF